MKPSSDLEAVHHDHSTLEVVQASPELTEKVLRPGQPQASSDGKTCISGPHSSSLSGLEEHERSCWKSRGARPRVFFISLAALLIAVAIGLGVGLGISLNNNNNDDSPPDTDSNKAKVDSLEHPLDIDFTPSHGILPSTGLGAINFTYLGNSARYVYWQTARGDIVESARSSHFLDWSIRDVTRNVAGAQGSIDVMMGTPIAATVLSDDQAFHQINVEFIDSEGRLQDLYKSSPEGDWHLGNIGPDEQAQAFPPAGAKVAAYWEQCTMCTTPTEPWLHIMYTNEAGHLQHWNSNFRVDWSPDEIQIPGATPLRSTGIAITEVRVGNGSELRAYYATSEHIQEIVFDKRTSTWIAGKQIPADIDPSSPPNITAISYGHISNGGSQFVLVVSSRPNENDYFAGLDTFLLTPDDEAFEQFNPDGLGQVANFSSVAMDMDGRLYALMVDAEVNSTAIDLREFIVDSSGTGWMMTGTVSPS